MSSTEGNPIRDGFTRQRRNLVVMSLIVLCIELLNVNFDTLNLLGNHITINNQHIVHAAMWIVLTYYLWRYYQYSHDLGDKGLLQSFYLKRNKLLNKAIRNDYIKSNINAKEFAEKYVKIRLHVGNISFYENIITLVSGESSIGIQNKDGTHNIGYKYKFRLHGWPLIGPSIISVAHVFVRTTYFSEYIFPYVIFILAFYFHFSSHATWFMSFFSSK